MNNLKRVRNSILSFNMGGCFLSSTEAEQVRGLPRDRAPLRSGGAVCQVDMLGRSVRAVPIATHGGPRSCSPHKMKIVKEAHHRSQKGLSTVQHDEDFEKKKVLSAGQIRGLPRDRAPVPSGGHGVPGLCVRSQRAGGASGGCTQDDTARGESG